MRTIFLTSVLIATASIAHGQSPVAKLPAQAEPGVSAAPNAGFDEVAARRKLEEHGYRDVRGLTPNGDGTMSGRAMRVSRDPTGWRGGTSGEVNVEIDASGRIRER